MSDGGLVSADQPGPTMDLVIVGAGLISVDIGCGSRPARLTVGRHVDRVRANWATCGGRRRVRLEATLRKPACDAMRGRVSAKREKTAPFVATLSTCGDRVLDVGVEECDESATDGDAACRGRCRRARVVDPCTCETVSATSIPTTSSTTTTVTTSTSTTLPVACGAPQDEMCGGRCPFGEVCDMAAENHCRCTVLEAIPCRVSLGAARLGWGANLASDNGAGRANGRFVLSSDLVDGAFAFADSTFLGTTSQGIAIDVDAAVDLDNPDCPSPDVPDFRTDPKWGDRLRARAEAAVAISTIAQPFYTPMSGVGGIVGDGLAVVGPGEEAVLQVEAIESGTEFNGSPAQFVAAQFVYGPCLDFIEYLTLCVPTSDHRPWITGFRLEGAGQLVLPYEAIPEQAVGLRTAHVAWFGNAGVSENVPGTQQKHASLIGYRVALAVRTSLTEH